MELGLWISLSFQFCSGFIVEDSSLFFLIITSYTLVEGFHRLLPWGIFFSQWKIYNLIHLWTLCCFCMLKLKLKSWFPWSHHLTFKNMLNMILLLDLWLMTRPSSEVEFEGGSLSPWIFNVILWLDGELNFIAFISLLEIVVINILLRIISPSKILLIPCNIFILFTSLWNFIPFPPLIVHDPLSNIVPLLQNVS